MIPSPIPGNMKLLIPLEAASISLMFLALVFIPMEKIFPAQKAQTIFRKGWKMDFYFFMGQYVLWSAWVLWCLQYFQGWLGSFIALSFQHKVQSLPWVVQAGLVLLLSDLLIYWAHRLQHKVDFLWRFHKVHHSAEELDWLAAHREHPLDSLYTVGLINLPAMILGFQLSSIAAIIAFRGIWAIFIHSNVKVNLGPLKWLIGSPELHHWHHDLDRRAGNYANVSPLMDILFGTYHCPEEYPEAYGTQDASPSTYVGHLVEPFRNKSNPCKVHPMLVIFGL